MDEIKIGAEIVFNITGNHNIGYAKGEKYIGTVLSEDHRSRLYVRTIGMPRACIDERDVEWVIDPDGDLDMDSGTHVDDFPAEIRIFTDNGLICLSITSVYLSGEDNLMVDGYDDDNEKIEGVDVYYDQISEIVYLTKIILEEMEEKDHGESG